MDPIELAARCSYPPNKLKLCGPIGSHEIFLKYINGEQVSAEVVKSIECFETASFNNIQKSEGQGKDFQ